MPATVYRWQILSRRRMDYMARTALAKRPLAPLRAPPVLPALHRTPLMPNLGLLVDREFAPSIRAPTPRTPDQRAKRPAQTRLQQFLRKAFELAPPVPAERRPSRDRTLRAAGPDAFLVCLRILIAPRAHFAPQSSDRLQQVLFPNPIAPWHPVISAARASRAARSRILCS